MSKHQDHHDSHCHCHGRSRRSAKGTRPFTRCTGEELRRLPRVIRMSVSHCESGKLTYFDHEDAELALAHVSREKPHRREQRTYLCPLCRGWHLTSQERKTPLSA